MRIIGVLALIVILASCSTPPQDEYQLGAMDIATQQARAYCSDFVAEASYLLFTEHGRLIDAARPGLPFGAIEQELQREHDYTTTALHWDSDVGLIRAYMQRDVRGVRAPVLLITNEFATDLDVFCIFDDAATNHFSE